MKRNEPEILFPAGRSLRGSAEGWPLPKAQRIILGRAAATNMPILLLRATGDWFLRIAEAIHRQSERDHFLARDLQQSSEIACPDGPISQRATLALDGIEHLSLPNQESLLDDLALRQPRLISGSALTLRELHERILPELIYLLAAVDLDTPNISVDPQNMLTAAEERIATLAGDFHRPAPRLSPSAREALSNHVWHGDDTELDGTLARTLLALPEGVAIEAADLVWSSARGLEIDPTRTTGHDASGSGAQPPTHAPTEQRPASSPNEPPKATRETGDTRPEIEPATSDPVPPRTEVQPTTSAPVAAKPDVHPSTSGLLAGAGPVPANGKLGPGQSTVESIAVELAHHLKNPLVTLKTFVANAGRLGEDPEKLARFSALAEESISRMDATLDELMDFARLQAEEPRSIDVLGCFRAALRDVWSGLDAKKVSLEGPEDQGFRSRLPPTHLTFAFRTLARYLEEAVEPRGTLTVEQRGETSLEVRFPEAQSQRHLREALLNSDESFPLSLLLVRGALIQSGGTFVVERSESQLRLLLGFPQP